MIEPLEEIADARDAAAAAGDPLARLATLATVTAAGAPRARQVVIRGLGRAGVDLMFTRLSPKWDELSTGAGYELVVYLPSQGRQYRLRGTRFEDRAEGRAEAWGAKAPESKWLDHFYAADRRQSAPLAGRPALVEGVTALRDRFPEGRGMPVPESLALVRLVPEEIELWHQSPDRLHRRWRCRRRGGGWSRELLVP